MKTKKWGWAIGGLIFFVFVLPTWAMVFEKPIEGQTIVIGESFDIWVRPEPKDVCTGILSFVGDRPFNSETGRFEWKETLGATSGDGRVNSLGTRRFTVVGEPARTCKTARVTLNVVLPPTTTVQSINANQLGNKGKKRLLLSLKLTPQKKVFSDRKDRIEVSGVYSDGVERDITMDSKTTYTSMDEKIAKVGVNQNWMWVTPVGPGKTEIVVSNGPHQDRLQVVVDEVVCRDEGDGYRCPF